MEYIWQIEVNINIFLQSLGAWLTPIMRFFSFFGQEEFYIPLIPFLYWCIDDRLALRFTYLLIASGYSNSLLKVTFHGARPYWIDRRVQALSSEYGFGMPSGHSQRAVSNWGLFATVVHKEWLRILFILVIIMIGISRLYLGVHFSTDVLCGWLLGALILWLFIKVETPVLNWFNRFSFSRKMLFFLILSLFLAALGTGWIAWQSQFPVPQAWIDNVNNTPGAQPINPFTPDEIISYCGLLLGASAGYVWIKNKFDFKPAAGSPQIKAARFLIGFVGLIIVSYGLAAILPHKSDLISWVCRYIRYTVSGLWISACAPLLFKQFKLLP